MKKILFIILFLSCLQIYAASFEALSGTRFQVFRHRAEAVSGLQDVFVFYGMEQASVRFVCGQPEACIWRTSRGALTQEQVMSESQASVLTQLQPQTLYIVRYESRDYAFYVINYLDFILKYGHLTAVKEAEDIAVSLQVALGDCSDDLPYYGLDGKKYLIEREHRFSYVDAVWNERESLYEDEPRELVRDGYVSSFVIDAPKQDVEFVLQGDQFLRYWDLLLVTTTCSYEAVSIETHAKAVITKGGEEEEGFSLTGSAPLEVDFFSYANPAADYCLWYIYTTPGSEEDYLYRKEIDIQHTFYSSGTYKIKLLVGNDVCTDSVEFSITVTESSLDCPNFFTPRSTPGENDEFRVAYESLVEFHGRILNRWGNLIFEWSDPDMGWDGTYKGNPVSPGVYFYVITATGSDGIEYVKRGDVNLIE